MVGVSLDDVEDVGGLLEVEELLVEIRALSEEAIELQIQSSLISNALVEKTRHGTNVGEATHVVECLDGAEVYGGRRQQILVVTVVIGFQACDGSIRGGPHFSNSVSVGVNV